MKKVVFKYKGLLRPDEIERTEIMINKDLNRQGFVILDDRWDVIEFGEEVEPEYERLQRLP